MGTIEKSSRGGEKESKPYKPKNGRNAKQNIRISCYVRKDSLCPITNHYNSCPRDYNGVEQRKGARVIRK